jgi:capsular exopolysaccharide synthesis family protein
VLPARRKKIGIATQDSATRYGEHLFVEAIDFVRTLLLHDESPERKRFLMVSSAMSREGKTMLASHLATSIARVGKRTLLIDGDLRKPSLHRLFEVQRVPGFAELLRLETTVEAAVRSTPAENLWILPAGEQSRDTTLLLAQNRVGELFDRLRNEFDVIILDSSPVLPVSDSLMLGRFVDACLLAIRPQVSQTPSVSQAHERLRALNIPVLGTVVTGVQENQKGRYYQYLMGSKS